MAQEAEVITILNRKRLELGLAPLNSHGDLDAAARRHSADMAAQQFISHTGSDGSSPWDRMRDAGYQMRSGRENVAVGYPTAQAVFEGWMNSPGHRDNMLAPNVCDIGMGYVHDAASKFGHYWTMALGCD